ncbi:hypothetical protein VTK26DRAFT_2841 [Humicola hyalothermophila]
MDGSPTSGGPRESNNMDSNEYSVTLAALILAAGAFVVALAQALMQYFSSSEARGKCTFEAIDISSKSTKLGWNWTFWKLRVYYPVLNISFSTVMRAAAEQRHIDAPKSPITRFRKAHGRDNWGFTVLDERETDNSFLTVTDGYTTLVNNSEPVTSKELTWAETAQLVWWKLKHHSGPVNRPRASWAQMLMALGIRDTRSLVYKHADADVIPGSVDAPIQRVKLYELGLLALYLGFKKVTIDTRERNFEAIGHFGTITTLRNNELGKVLHFEGDILAIFAQISKGSIGAYEDCVIGKLSFAPGVSTNGIICPLHLLLLVIANRWDRDTFRDKQRQYLRKVQTEEGLTKGQIAAEASLFDMLYSNPSLAVPRERKGAGLGYRNVLSVDPDEGFQPKKIQKTTTGLSAGHLGALIREDDEDINYHDLCLAIEHWTKATSLRLPTIIAAASLCFLTGRESGYPSSVIITPIMPWISALAEKVKHSSEPFTHVSSRMTTQFKTNSLLFVRSRDTFWYSMNYIGMDGRTNMWGWILRDTHEIYDSLPPEDQDDLIMRGPAREYTGDVQPVLLTECYALLQQFNPREWAARIERIITMQLLKFRPHNMVWTQILLLDVAIHFMVRGGFHRTPPEGYDHWPPQVTAVFKAIISVWDPSAEAQAAREAAEAGDKPPSRPSTAATKADKTDATTGNSQANPPPADQEKPLAPTTTQSQTHTQPSPLQRTYTSHTAGGDGVSSNSWSKGSREEAPKWDVEWDLAGALLQQDDLFPELEGSAREHKVQKLACLLQLRALFVIALFLLMPDSSDVYLADGERVEMPMV